MRWRLTATPVPAGVDFEDCWGRRMLVTVGSVEAGFISYDDLIANKRASGRSQDAVDVEVLEGMRADPPDAV